MICRIATPAASWSMPSLIPSNVIVDETSDSTGSRPDLHSETNGDVAGGDSRPEIAADQRPSLGDEPQRRHGDSSVGWGRPTVMVRPPGAVRSIDVQREG